MVPIYVKICVDIICVLIAWFLILMFHFFGEPFERGFFCNDESLMHPYKSDTVPSWSLAFGFIIPTIVIILTEFLLSIKLKEKKIKYKLKAIPGWIQEVYAQVGPFLFGAGVLQLLTDIAKVTIGRLRPHFFDVCKPNVDCSNPALANKYITTYTCTGLEERRIGNMRLSFPSGHSATAMYCMLYLSLYIHSRYKWSGSKLLKNLLQFFAMATALFVALSRVSDYKHHWSDVLAGSVLGITVATVTMSMLVKCEQETLGSSVDLFPMMRLGLKYGECFGGLWSY